jgi:hypothetical protein
MALLREGPVVFDDAYVARQRALLDELVGPVVFDDAYVAHQRAQLDALAVLLDGLRVGENTFTDANNFVRFSTTDTLRAITDKKTNDTIIFDGARVVLEYLGLYDDPSGTEKLSVVRRDTSGNVTMMIWKQNGAPSRAHGPAIVQLERGEQGVSWRCEYVHHGRYWREDGPAQICWGDSAAQIVRQRWTTVRASSRDTQYHAAQCRCMLILNGRDHVEWEAWPAGKLNHVYSYGKRHRMRDLPSYYHPVSHSQWPAAMRRRLRAVAAGAAAASLALLLNLSEFQAPAARCIFDLR